jgi:HK97 family phage prohead protease
MIHSNIEYAALGPFQTAHRDDRRAGYGAIEYGAPVSMDFRRSGARRTDDDVGPQTLDVVGTWLRDVRQALASAERGEAPTDTIGTIRGVACAFEEPHEFKGDTCVFLRGAFAETLASQSKVAFLIGHDPNSMVATSESGLELRESDHGLCFQLAVPNTLLGRRAMRMVREGEAVEMSVGTLPIRTEPVELAGRALQLKHSVDLVEVSLCSSGVVPQTWAAVADDDLTLAQAIASDLLPWAEVRHRMAALARAMAA